MVSGITWVYSEKGGYFPCSNSQELGEFKRAGFVECGKPSKHKAAVASKTEKPALVEKHSFSYTSNEDPSRDDQSREELIALAEDKGIFIDKRWTNQRIKDAVNS